MKRQEKFGTPLAATEVFNPPTHGFTTAVDRHDHHNLEIKATFETGGRAFEGELDLYLYVPRSFDLRSWNKMDLERDVRSRIRLAIPMHGEHGLAALTHAREMFAAAVVEFVNNSDTNRSAAETLLVESARELCAAIAETLKIWIGTQTRALGLAHTRLATETSCLKELESLRESLERAGELMTDIRRAASPALDRSVLQAFDEYLSYIYVQYLGSIRAELDRNADAPSQFAHDKYMVARKQLEKTLRRLTQEEAEYRMQFAWAPREQETELAREYRILRMSYLKKFFQSRSFVDVSRRPALKRVSESTALVATAAAGFLAAFVQMFTSRSSAGVTLQGTVVLCLGVAVYVLRDRLKDKFKERFKQEASKFLPDYEQVLLAREQKIGECKEWFHIRECASVPKDVRLQRKNASTNEIELRLPEDVFQYRKVQTILNKQIKQMSDFVAVQALHESVRINFERYLKHMDDPFKEFIELDHDGEFHRNRSHRVYHFYLGVRTCGRLLGGRRNRAFSEVSETRLFRIVVDKNGIVRIEESHTSTSDLSAVAMVQASTYTH